MMANDRQYRVREVDTLKDLFADDRVNLCLFEFGRRQHAGLVENLIRHSQLANIVQQRSSLHRG